MNFFALTFNEVIAELQEKYGKGFYHAKALFREVYRNNNSDLTDVPELIKSPKLSKQLLPNIYFPKCKVVSTQVDEDVTKFASELEDGSVIETVIIPADKRTTLCISSQVGCKMGCDFCSTAKLGFRKNLTTEEMIWQIYTAWFHFNSPIDNIVFMGMGEPLDNFDNVIKAVEVMGEQRGFGISHRHITISTSGLLPGIKKFNALNLPHLHLALSLNASDNETRDKVMPINKVYPIEEVIAELRKTPLGDRDGIFVEYVLLEGVNDSKEDVERIKKLLDGLEVRINVIAYNQSTDTPYRTPSPEHTLQFCQWLMDEKFFVRLRQPRGNNIEAACGQLSGAVTEGNK